jgi:hypothetical protein
VSLGSVDVEAGETAHADLVLVSGGLVAGTVREADGTPVPGALVAALDAGPGQGQPGMGLRPTTADADGAYLLPLAAGSHGLTALRPEEAGGRMGRPQVLARVEVTVGQRSDLDLVLPPRPAATLVGLVLEPGGAPSVGATVWTGGAGAGLQLATADGEGRFTLAAPGSDPVTVRSRNGGRAATLTTTPPQAGLVVQLLPAATIQGVLVGDPAPETFELTSTVRGLPFGGPPTQLQFGGAAFLLEDQLPGEVALHVRTSDGRIGDASATVAAAETASVAVALSLAASVTGRLVDAATGAPLTRARLLLDGQPSRRGAVGADGRFSRVMGVGPHTLTAQAAGYQPLAASVTARAEAPVDLGDLALTPVAATPAGPTGPSGPGTGR